MNLHKHQLYLLEQNSESFKCLSAIIRINTEGKSLIMKFGPGLINFMLIYFHNWENIYFYFYFQNNWCIVNHCNFVYIQRASSSEEVCLQTLRDTQVLLTKDHKIWDLDLIEYVLKVCVTLA